MRVLHPKVWSWHKQCYNNSEEGLQRTDHSSAHTKKKRNTPMPDTVYGEQKVGREFV